ncbi:hypothetical protein CLOP_g7612 [Closterium sp. NIES-67]|nr:hypothetical protein CLOP_g7612 [Closterium sp. NIES-67]
MSRKLNPTERNYPVHDKELLAIVHAFKVWCCYVTSIDVTVQTDHKSLQFIRVQPTLNPRQIRWLNYLESNFHYKVTYIRGVSNIADALTRPSVHTAAQGTHYLKSGTNRIWVPTYRTLRKLLIHEAHDFNFSGHYSIDKTTKLLSRNYYWPNLPTDVQQYVTSYATCQRMKSSRLQPAGLLQPLEPPSRPWQQVTMDFVTGLPAGSSGNDTILVAVDRLTKMTRFAACKTTTTAEQTAKTFLTNIVRQSSAIVTHGSRPTYGQKHGSSTAHICICLRRTTRNRMVRLAHQPDDGAADSHDMHRPGLMGRRPSLDRVCVQKCPIGHEYSVPVLP